MKQKFLQLIKHPFVSGSTIMVAGYFFANILNWILNLLIGGRHLLSVSDYGVYSTSISLTVLFGIFQASFTNIFAKFAAKYRVAKDDESFSALLFSGGRSVITFTACMTII